MRYTESSLLCFEYREFARDFQEVRRERKCSVKKVARQLGIDHQVIHRIERAANHSGASILYAAYWADLDIRCYLRYKEDVQRPMFHPYTPSVTVARVKFLERPIEEDW